MKFFLAGLALVAAVAALVFVPPHAGSPIAVSAPGAAGIADRTTGPGRLPLQRPRDATAASKVTVYVAGEVTRPGVYRLAPGARAQDALTRAGGPLPDADLVAVNLAARLNDGDEIAVEKLGTEPPHRRLRRTPHPRASHRPRGHSRSRPPDGAVVGTMHSIDLNAADTAALENVPGIGAALAERIVAYRAANGPFNSVDELADVSGITPRLQDALSAFVVIR